ncbi:MAG: 50S ribosomal protein L1 [Deltaproteobacteria bacterium RIFCSPLOWO2_02_FULL_44_10]|nr:MAG: 50S ribosomal protein L1 [Deltaproteobacteria bacterium RIFCSPHIGHO2_02_FULL_44_16]OGQ45113.1 MAG: 50S ribosomal protein L1 [Deltaproteobacteria bacterium RIFCSPLOWO2_02_FULL_44_10]
MGKKKKYQEDRKKVDPEKRYSLDQALEILESFSKAKFDESVDVALRLGIDAKQSDQVIRGAVGLPNGTGKKVRVAVFAKAEKVKEAEDAGADIVGSDDLVQKIQGGWLEFDTTIATPDMMGLVGKLGKVLGPRGLMPNPKLGTVTNDLVKAIQETKAGKVEFRTDKAGIVHAPVGKRSFGRQKLKENISTLIEAVVKAKPASSKGTYLQVISISGTMTPGVFIDPETVIVQ